MHLEKLKPIVAALRNQLIKAGMTPNYKETGLKSEDDHPVDAEKNKLRQELEEKTRQIIALKF